MALRPLCGELSRPRKRGTPQPRCSGRSWVELQFPHRASAHRPGDAYAGAVAPKPRLAVRGRARALERRGAARQGDPPGFDGCDRSSRPVLAGEPFLLLRRWHGNRAAPGSFRDDRETPARIGWSPARRLGAFLGARREPGLPSAAGRDRGRPGRRRLRASDAIRSGRARARVPAPRDRRNRFLQPLSVAYPGSVRAGRSPPGLRAGRRSLGRHGNRPLLRRAARGGRGLFACSPRSPAMRWYEVPFLRYRARWASPARRTAASVSVPR